MGLKSLIIERIPTEWEQDIAEKYVNERQIVRPNTNIKTALISFLLFLVVSSVFTWLVHYIFITVNIFTLCAIVIFVELLFCFKYAIIGVIKLYQHYAPEEIRRRCLFMPTCSEYAIMAIRKYGSIIGLCKSYFRLFYRCRGNIYMIDYP